MSEGTFGAKNIGLTLLDSAFGAKNIGLTLMDFAFGAKNIGLTRLDSAFGTENIGLTLVVRVTLSELGAWKSFSKFFFLLNFSLGSSRASLDPNHNSKFRRKKT